MSTPRGKTVSAWLICEQHMVFLYRAVVIEAFTRSKLRTATYLFAGIGVIRRTHLYRRIRDTLSYQRRGQRLRRKSKKPQASKQRMTLKQIMKQLYVWIPILQIFNACLREYKVSMKVAHHLPISDTKVMKVQFTRGPSHGVGKDTVNRRSVLQRSSRRMEGRILRRVCLVRCAKSCNQSLYDTNMYLGCVGAVRLVRALLPCCMGAQRSMSCLIGSTRPPEGRPRYYSMRKSFCLEGCI